MGCSGGGKNNKRLQHSVAAAKSTSVIEAASALTKTPSANLQIPKPQLRVLIGSFVFIIILRQCPAIKDRQNQKITEFGQNCYAYEVIKVVVSRMTKRTGSIVAVFQTKGRSCECFGVQAGYGNILLKFMGMVLVLIMFVPSYLGHPQAKKDHKVARTH